MSVPLRIVTFFGGVLFIILALGIVIPPLSDVLSDPKLDELAGNVAVVLMVLFFGAAPAFVGVRLIRRSVRDDPGAVVARQPLPGAAVAEPAPLSEQPAPVDATVARASAETAPVAPPPSSYDAALPPPPSERRAVVEAAAHAATLDTTAQARPWSARLAALFQSPLGLALVTAIVTIPLMVLLRIGGAYVGTLALTFYAIAVIGMSAIHKSWSVSALTSAGTGMMLFIVLAMTAGALEQGEGNNPVFMLPGLLFYVGIGLTGVARFLSRRAKGS